MTTSSATSPLRWGILGTGAIARKFAEGVAASAHGKLVAVGSRTAESAAAFVAKYPDAGPIRAHASYDALLADSDVQAVYIATPHPQHAEWAIRAAEAGKHILCEKPITLNLGEAMSIAEAARANGVLLMEAFMYRCHPQIAKLKDLLTAGTIGQVRLIESSFSFNAGFNAESRLFKNELGGGGILDVGCYAMSMARLVAGVATGHPFANPTRVTGSAVLSRETGVDLFAVAAVEFPGQILAQLRTGVHLNAPNVVRIVGVDGIITLGNPWIPGLETTIVVEKGGKTEEIAIKAERSLYALEADAVAAALERGELSTPEMPVADTLGNMAALDQWRQAVGLTYEIEKPQNWKHTNSRRPLKKRADSPMLYGKIAGVEKPVSRLILGCDNQQTLPFGAAMWDDFFERGGTTFDTAWLYAGGLQERLLGQWMAHRGNREEIVVIGKGAHTPHCDPASIKRQLKETLERLQTGYVDLYIMHRDNLDVPIADFVEVLNEEQKAGRVRAFGGSNWSLARVKEFNDYAMVKGLTPMALVNNNFSLARMVDAVWTGCIASSTPEWKAWLTETQVPLLSWSSQARGFFTDRAGRDKLDDAELTRCWYSDDNFERRERAIELADKKGVEPINIVLAYVLAQTFPTFALIGPRFISETASSFEGLKVKLTPGEVAWLNLEAEKAG